MILKVGLDSISYTGYFFEGKTATFEEVIERAGKWGYDGVELFPHRPMAAPIDLDQDRRKKLLELAESNDVEISAIGAATNFMQSNHILAQTQDKELLFVRECCKLASDLNVKVMRIFTAWIGYFMPPESGQGYTSTAFHSRSIDVSTEDDYLKQWEFARKGIKEAGMIAKDYGVTLALQNHPPLTMHTEDTISMVEEVNLDSVKICLDAPLFLNQDEEYINKIVKETGKRMVHSHMIGIVFKDSLGGTYGFDEVVPGEGRENWPAFIKACKEIGYEGYLSYEQCSAIILKGHKKATIEEVDRRAQAGLKYMNNLMKEVGCYTGHK